MPVEGSADNPVNIGPFAQIVNVGWNTRPPSPVFEVSVASTSSIEPGTGIPPHIVFSISTEGTEVSQTLTTDIDHTEPLSNTRSFNQIYRITGATKVTLDISGPSSPPDVNFNGTGTIEYSPAEGTATDIDAEIGRNPNLAVSATADPTMDHPTGVTINPSAGSAELIYDSTDATPRPR